VATLAEILDTALKIGIGAVIGFIASVLRDFLNIKNKTNQEYKIKKQQKLEELLNLLETTKKDSLISMSLLLEEDGDDQIKILKKILQSQFENPEIIKFNEENYAKIKTISNLYLNKYEQHVDRHITIIKGLDFYRQISLENAINSTKLVSEFGDKQALTGKESEKVEHLNQKFKDDRHNEEELEKKLAISLDEFKTVIIKELNS